MIRIGLDISQLAHYGGVATYTLNLAKNLQSQTGLEMVYFYSSLRRPYRGQLLNVKQFKLPPSFFEILFNKLHNVPIERFLGSVDIFHSSDWVQPPSKAKKVTTYHDVIPLKFPQWSHPKIVAVQKRRLALVEKEIDYVIAVSQATKKDLLEISQIPEKKIVVIYEGIDQQFKKQKDSDVEKFRERHHLPAKFILAIGGVGERRNLTAIKKVCEGYNLVITNQTIPLIPSQELPLLFASATILLYPSFYEGFGLPILEAQACGVPVITSNVSSMPEVAGDGAILVDPNNVAEIQKNVKAVMGDEPLRNRLVNKGLENVKRFSWEKCANQTAEVYRDLFDKNG